MARKEAGIQHLVKAVSFILIFTLLLTGVSYIVRTNGHVKNRFAGFYSEKKDSIDVIICGGSTAGTSFAPGYIWGKYGITSYPVSSNTQRPKAIRYLLEETLKTQSPKLAVIELRMFTYKDEVLKTDEAHIREVTDNMKYSFHRFKTVKNLTDGVEGFENKLSYYFDIIKYHSNWAMFFFPEEWQKITYSKPDLHKGFEHHTDIMYFDNEEIGYEPTDDRMPIPSEQEAQIQELMDFLKENNMEAVFVATPYLYDYEKEYYAMMNYLKDIVQQEGFAYMDLMDYADLDCTTDYLDGGHCNILGAYKCSDVLGKFISENYDFKDKREQAGYESWDKSFDAFMELYTDVNDNKEKYMIESEKNNE